MSRRWGAPPPVANDGDASRVEQELAERTRSKLLAKVGTIRALFNQVSDSVDRLPVGDFVACLASLGFDALRPPMAEIVEAHTSGRGLVNCTSCLDELISGAPQPQPQPEPEPEPAPSEPAARRARAESRGARRAARAGGASRGRGGARKPAQRKGPPLRVIVRVQNFPKERALAGLMRLDPDETGEVPVEGFVSVLKGVGMATDQVSVLLKEHPRSRGSSGSVRYREFIDRVTTPVPPEEQARQKLQARMHPADAAPAPAPAPATTTRRPAPRRVTQSELDLPRSDLDGDVDSMLHKLSEAESRVAEELWSRCEELEQELRTSQSTLSSEGATMMDESKMLMAQLREYQAQCRRETGESLTMVVETRRMLAIVTEEKDRLATEREELQREVIRLRREVAELSDAGGASTAKASQVELDSVQLRSELATARSEASYMKTRVRELDDELGASTYHLATLQEENATLLDECERLQAASKAASRPANGAGLTRRERAKATWEEDERDEERRAAEGGGKGRAGRGRRHREGSG